MIQLKNQTTAIFNVYYSYSNTLILNIFKMLKYNLCYSNGFTDFCICSIAAPSMFTWRNASATKDRFVLPGTRVHV